MRKSALHLALFALTVGSVGCSVAARDATMYAQDTQKVLESKNAAIKTCYDEALKTDAKVAGTVTVKFTVKADTGDLTDIKVDAAGTTAPEALSQCVVTSIQGLKLAPPDDQEGLATYTWSFQVGGATGLAPAVAPPAAAPAPAAAAPAADAKAGIGLGLSAGK